MDYCIRGLVFSSFMLVSHTALNFFLLELEMNWSCFVNFGNFSNCGLIVYSLMFYNGIILGILLILFFLSTGVIKLPKSKFKILRQRSIIHIPII